jgi:hypothetical protein
MDVKKRFGVTPVTYYSWRKKSGSAGGARGRRTGMPRGSAARDDLAGMVRAQVRRQIQEMLPEIVRGELEGTLGGLRRR